MRIVFLWTRIERIERILSYESTDQREVIEHEFLEYNEFTMRMVFFWTRIERILSSGSTDQREVIEHEFLEYNEFTMRMSIFILPQIARIFTDFLLLGQQLLADEWMCSPQE